MSSVTRQQMIETAARLFQRDGYRATTWRALVDEAGTPWGSISHHFPGGKEELGAAAIEAGGNGVAGLIDHCFATTEDAPGAVAKWFHVSAKLMSASGYQAGCPVATVALETVPASDVLTTASREAFGSWEQALTRHLVQAGIGRASAAERATLIVTLMEGALVLSRVRGSTTPLKLAGRQAATLAA